MESYVQRSNEKMYHYERCIILFGIILNACRTHGALQINLPANNVGIYGHTTILNCTDTPFDVTNGYNWYKDNAIVYNTASGDATGTGKYRSSDGADYFTLEITNTALDDNGDYKCQYNFQDVTGTLSILAKGSGKGKKVNDKVEITLTGLYPGSPTVLTVTCSGKTLTQSGTDTVKPDGNFFIVEWKSTEVDDTSVLENGCDVTISSIITYTIHVGVDLGRCPDDCKIRVIVSIVFGSLGIIALALAIIFIVANCFNNPACLTVDVIGLVSDIISLGLSASVIADDKDSKDWILNSAKAFAAIPSVAAVGAIVVFFLVYLGVIGPGRNGN